MKHAIPPSLEWRRRRRMWLAGAAAIPTVWVFGFVGTIVLSKASWERVDVDCQRFRVDRAVWQWRLSGYDLPRDLERPAEQQFAGAVRCNLLYGLTERQIAKQFTDVWSGDPAFGVHPSLRMSPRLTLELDFGSNGRVNEIHVEPPASEPDPDLPQVECPGFKFDPERWHPEAIDGELLDVYRKQLAGLVRCGDLIGLTVGELHRTVPGGRLEDDRSSWLAASDSFNDFLVVHVSPTTGRAYDVNAVEGDSDG